MDPDYNDSARIHVLLMTKVTRKRWLSFKAHPDNRTATSDYTTLSVHMAIFLAAFNYCLNFISVLYFYTKGGFYYEL